MNCIFQVVRASDGVRSPAAEAAREDFARVLREMLSQDDTLSPDDMVLVMMEETSGQWDVSKAPLVRVERFVNAFAPEVTQ